MASSRRDGSYCRYSYVEKPKRDSEERDKEFGDILKKCADKFEDLVKHRIAMRTTGRDGGFCAYSYLEKPEFDSDEIKKEIGKILKKRADEFEYVTKCRITMVYTTRHDDSHCTDSYVERTKLGCEKGYKEFGEILKKCADEFEHLVKHRITMVYTTRLDDSHCTDSYVERSKLGSEDGCKEFGEILKKCADEFEHSVKHRITMVATKHDGSYCTSAYLERSKLDSDDRAKEFGKFLKKCVDKYVPKYPITMVATKYDGSYCTSAYLERSELDSDDRAKEFGKFLKKCVDKYVPKYPDPKSSIKKPK